MSGVRKGLAKVEIALRWDPSPAGTPAHDLDILAAVYDSAALYGDPVYLVHFGSRAPDGTITLNRDSDTGQGLGFDEVMTLELNRLAPGLGRVVVGVVIQDPGPEGARTKTFATVAGTGLRIREGYTDLARSDFADVGGFSAVTVAEFLRDSSGGWSLDARPRGFDADPEQYARLMAAPRP
ncbi:TerD-family protein [Streptomyces cirratus]|uniref:TerD-family protein n=1 Tax=Streptomyces cirratus TaxID=68187 RepID=A0ABQ3ET98_9ACTN|nr:TerD family protein [Streptomyces cirratus]GHB58197.1 TerD-family protein [Streptomyces cirratus]